MKQPPDSSGKPRYPSKACLVVKSLYGVRQAGKIWGSYIHKQLLKCDFCHPSQDQHLHFFSRGQHFLILIIVVDDMAFTSVIQQLIDHFNDQMSFTFKMKLLGKHIRFPGWHLVTHLRAFTSARASMWTKRRLITAFLTSDGSPHLSCCLLTAPPDIRKRQFCLRLTNTVTIQLSVLWDTWRSARTRTYLSQFPCFQGSCTLRPFGTCFWPNGWFDTSRTQANRTFTSHFRPERPLQLRWTLTKLASMILDAQQRELQLPLTVPPAFLSQNARPSLPGARPRLNTSPPSGVANKY